MAPTQPFRITALALVLLGASGCSFAIRETVLHYPPDDDPRQGAQRPSPLGDLRPVLVLELEDARRVTDAVGDIRRTDWRLKYGMVVTDSSIPGWVREALAWELERAGFRVVEHAGLAEAKTADVVNGRVTKVYCPQDEVYAGEVELRLVLKRDGRTLLRRNYVGRASQGILETGVEAGPSDLLAMALRQAAEEFVRDVRDLSPPPAP